MNVKPKLKLPKVEPETEPIVEYEDELNLFTSGSFQNYVDSMLDNNGSAQPPPQDSLDTVDQQILKQEISIEPERRKRGRPRKNSVRIKEEHAIDTIPSRRSKKRLKSPKLPQEPAKAVQWSLLPGTNPTVKKPFLCKDCGKCYTSLTGLTGHERVHSGEALPFSCGFCQKRFQFAAGLEYHISAKHSDLPYTCEYCSKMFPNRFTLNSHTRMHTGEKPYQCKYCPERFPNHAGMMHHIRREHQDQHQPGTTINRIAKPKKTTSALPGKRRRKSDSTHKIPGARATPRVQIVDADAKDAKSNEFHCNFCNNFFTSNDALICHLRTHAGQKPYWCDLCEQDFTSFGSYVSHKTKVHAVALDCLDQAGF